MAGPGNPTDCVGLRSVFLDAAAGVSVPQHGYFDTGKRGEHFPTAGGTTGEPGGGLQGSAGGDDGNRSRQPDGGRGGTVPYIISPAVVSYTQTTGVAAKSVGYVIGGLFILVAFLPKVSAIFSSIPGPVMAGFLVVLSGYLFVDGARTVMQSEENRARVTVAGVCFWIGASFQFGLFSLPDVGPVFATLVQSGITTGGVAAIIMILYLEFTNPRRMRFKSDLDIEVLPELNEFLEKFADRRGWDTAMKERLSAVAEETLLSLSPLDLESFMLEEEESEDDEEMEDTDADSGRQLVVLASSDGPVATLEFIGGVGMRRTWRTAYTSCSNMTRRRRWSRSYRCGC